MFVYLYNIHTRIRTYIVYMFLKPVDSLADKELTPPPLTDASFKYASFFFNVLPKFALRNLELINCMFRNGWNPRAVWVLPNGGGRGDPRHPQIPRQPINRRTTTAQRRETIRHHTWTTELKNTPLPRHLDALHTNWFTHWKGQNTCKGVEGWDVSVYRFLWFQWNFKDFSVHVNLEKKSLFSLQRRRKKKKFIKKR